MKNCVYQKKKKHNLVVNLKCQKMKEVFFRTIGLENLCLRDTVTIYYKYFSLVRMFLVFLVQSIINDLNIYNTRIYTCPVLSSLIGLCQLFCCVCFNFSMHHNVIVSVSISFNRSIKFIIFIPACIKKQSWQTFALYPRPYAISGGRR